VQWSRDDMSSEARAWGFLGVNAFRNALV
jgi:hypothetical protein